MKEHIYNGNIRLCNQCSYEIYGRIYYDADDLEQDQFGAILWRCDGCGWTLLDTNGNCRLPHHAAIIQPEMPFEEESCEAQ